MSVQHSPLYHQVTCGIIPVGGRTIIRRHRANRKIGSFHLPDNLRGRYQEDWVAEVVAVAPSGGWRQGVIKDSMADRYANLEDRPPDAIPKSLRKDPSIWKVAPYYVKKPEVMPGSMVICCWLAGQPFTSLNGYDYYMTDGEHAYKVILSTPTHQPNASRTTDN